MSKRIGEALVENGLLEPIQLERGLRAQLIFGGHLGTSLIELGYIDEAALGRALGDVLGLRYAPRELFEAIPESITRLFSSELVRRIRAVPIGREEDTLHVAVIDAKSLVNLSLFTGYKIVPWIAPEIRIVHAMEQYYGVPRRPRFIKLSYELDKRNRRRRSRSLAEEQRPPRVPVPSAAGVAPPEPLALPSTTGRPASALERLSKQLSRVIDERHLRDVVVGYAAKRMARCVLFEIDGEIARARSWKGEGLDPDAVQSLALPVTTHPIFALMSENLHYRGSVPDDPDCRAFYTRLGIRAPAEILVLPSYVDDRLQSVLYGDGGGLGCIHGPTELYLALAEKISLAKNMLFYKLQLCSG